MTYRSVYAEKYHSADPESYPLFRYHPDPLSNGVFEETDTPVVCPCCGKETPIYYAGTFHTDEDIDMPPFCPSCIADGSAAEKFDGEFRYDEGETLSDPDLIDAIIHRTPDYITLSWSGWRVHCDDYCAYLRSVSYNDIIELGLLEEIKQDMYWQKDEKDPLGLLRSLERYGPPQGHLFQCLTCGKHLLYIDLEENYD